MKEKAVQNDPKIIQFKSSHFMKISITFFYKSSLLILLFFITDLIVTENVEENEGYP